jgi:ketosteroid isomerase-like protein
MSRENVEVVLEGVKAVNRRDPDALVACVHPDVVWVVGDEMTLDLGGVYRGRAGVREWFEKSFLDVWEVFDLEVEEVNKAGDDGVFLGVHVTARGRDSGVEGEGRGWQVCWFADGKISRRKVFLHPGDALEAAGLSE